MLLHAMSLLVQQRMRLEIELMQDQARLIVLPPPCPQAVQPIDFSKAGQLVEQGLEASRAFLKGLGADGSPRARRRHADRLMPNSHG
jgi:NTE family protein